MAANNKTIGRFHLTGLPPAPRGVPQIEVAFDIDANGILNVSAKDQATGKEQSIRIEASSGLTEKEIDQMVHDAEAHVAEDKEKREQIEIKNKADHMVYESEKNLKDMGEKLSADDKAKIEAAIERVKKSLEGDNFEEMKSATEALTTVYGAAAQKLYEQAAQAGAGAQAGAAGAGPQGAGAAGPGPKAGPSGGQGSGDDKDDAVDADYEVVD
jgi:molecular chaperone DnaK